MKNCLIKLVMFSFIILLLRGPSRHFTETVWNLVKVTIGCEPHAGVKPSTINSSSLFARYISCCRDRFRNSH